MRYPTPPTESVQPLKAPLRWQRGGERWFNPEHQRGRLAALLVILLMSGCATNVEVQGDIPQVLSVRLPMKAGLVFDEAFRDFTYHSKRGKEVSFAMGKAQVKMFQTITAGLFQEVTVLKALPPQPEAVDIVIIPHVEEIQLALPYETQLNVFEVWLKYNLQVFDGTGEPVADWIMTAYGKTPTRFMKSDAEALNQAAIVALRDAGARLITGFTRVPEIHAWLQQRTTQTANSEEAP